MRYVVLGLPGLLVLCSGCARPAPAAPKEETKELPVVRLIKPERKIMTREVEQPGRIRALAETPIHVRLPGYIKELTVDIGDRVTGPVADAKDPEKAAGQVLARLDVPEVEAEADAKRLLVVQADAEVVQADEALNTAKARVNEAKAGIGRVDADLKRWQTQLKALQVASGTVEKQLLEESRYQVDAAKAAADEQEAKVKAIEAAAKKAAADVVAARAKRDAVAAEQRKAVAWLAYGTVRAPFDGVVTRRYADVGHFRQPGAPGPRGEPLFVITRTDKVRVFLEIPEADAVLVNAQTTVRVRVPVLKNAEFPAASVRTSWALDARSRTLELLLDLDNKDGRLHTEMYAVALITLSFGERLTLPASAVVGQGDAAYVVRVVEGKAVGVPVKVGVSAGGLVEVTQKQTADGWKPVTEADEFVKENAATLADGQVVRSADR